MRRLSAWVLVLAVALAGVSALIGCYRPRAPEDLGQSVCIEITGNEARLVRIQGYLQRAVAAALTERLGWQVTPTGSARLQLHVEEEDITSSGTDQRNTPNRWTVVIRGQALLNSRRCKAASAWSGSGYASALSSTTDDEASALKNAAASAALTIATWLEAELRSRPGSVPVGR